MRRLGRALLLGTCLVVLTAIGWSAWREWQRVRSLNPAVTAGLDERVLFAPLKPDGLAFNVSTHQGWFALQGFVVASTPARLRGLPITIEVNHHAADGTEIVSQRRFLALPPVARARPYGLLDGRADQGVWILPTEWLDLTGQDDVRSVSVRVVQAPQAVQAVLWRGAIDQRLTVAQARLRYRRLSDAARDDLTAQWVTPASLIEPQLKYELLRWRQQRIGPLGQPGEDFVPRRVLRQRELTGPPTYVERYHALPISPSMRVSVRLDRARTVRIDARGTQGQPLTVSLWQRGPDGPAQTRVLQGGRWSGTLPPGLHELRAAAAGDVEVRDAGTGEPLAPDGRRAIAHRADRQRSLAYRLYPLGNRVPPVRLRVRAERQDTVVQVRFLDEAGRLLASQTVPVPWSPSRYDRRSDALDRAASEPVQVELLPPPLARAMAVSTDAAALVSALTTVPAGPQAPGRQRWHSFMPDVDARSPLSLGVVVLEQPRPVAPAPANATAGARPTTAAAEHSTRRYPPPGGPAQRPRLRLRAERPDPDEEVGDGP